MKEIWQRVGAVMIRGIDMRAVLIKSCALALCACIFALPYFHHLIMVVEGQARVAKVPNPWGLLLAELGLLFLICFLSALTGLTFSERLGLPGFGNPKNLVNDSPLILLLGAVMTALSYCLFDRYFFEISPVSYPKDALFLIAAPFKGAFTEEIILRLCLLTLCVGLLKSRVAGVVLVSVVGSLFTLKYFHFIGVPFSLNYLFATQLLLSFSANLLLGYLFVTRGLLYAMGLKFLFGIKYAFVSWTMG